MDRICPKCNGKMLKGMEETKGRFTTIDINHIVNRPVKGFNGLTKTTKFMCEKCGLIEEYGDNVSLGLENGLLKDEYKK